MRKTILAAAVVFVSAGTPAKTQEHVNSGNVMLPMCKAWLGMMSQDAAAIKDELATGNSSPGGIPAYFMGVGMCAGEVAGIAEMLNGSEACIPKEVTKEQVVRVVATALEGTQAHLHEDFALSAAAAIAIAWPCHK